MAATIVFKHYNPTERWYAGRRTDGEWEGYRECLIVWHNEGASRRKMRDKLAHFGFKVSPKQLDTKLLQWGLVARDRADGHVMSNAVAELAAHTDTWAVASIQAVNEPVVQDKAVQVVRDGIRNKAIVNLDIPPDGNSTSRRLEDEPQQRTKCRDIHDSSPCCCVKMFDQGKPMEIMSALGSRMVGRCAESAKLKHAVALISFCQISRPNTDMFSVLRESRDFYTSLLARSNIQNLVAATIQPKLAELCSSWAYALNDSDWNTPNNDLYCMDDHLQDLLCKVQKASTVNGSEVSTFLTQIFENPAYPELPTSCRSVAEDCANVLVRNVGLLVAHSMNERNNSKDYQQPSLRPRLEEPEWQALANHISLVLELHGREIGCWGNHLANARKGFTAIGTAIAQSFHEEIGQARLRLATPLLLENDLEKCIMRVLTLVRVPARRHPSGRDQIIPDLYKAMLETSWSCDPRAYLCESFNRNEDSFHKSQLWQCLDLSIRYFDETSVMPLHTNPWSPPSDSLLQNPFWHEMWQHIDQSPFHLPDGYGSTLASSTTSSFKRFRNLAVRLGERTGKRSAKSGSSEWSGHISVDSWNLDRMLDVVEEMEGKAGISGDRHMFKAENTPDSDDLLLSHLGMLEQR